MAHTILIPSAVAAQKIDSYNRNIKASVDLDNGMVLALSGKSTADSEGEVWTATKADGTESVHWIHYNPEEVNITNGKWRGVENNIKEFYVPSGKVSNAFLAQKGDIITVSADGFKGTYTDGTTKYAYVSSSNPGLFTFAASKQASTPNWAIVKVTYISVGEENMSTQRTLAYQLELVD